jgi:hypothetical protein
MRFTEDLPDSFPIESDNTDTSKSPTDSTEQKTDTVDRKKSIKEKINNFFDSIIVWAFAHPFIAILLITVPFLLLYAPAATIVFSIMGVFIGILLFLNAGIIYIYGMIDANNNLTFKKSILLSLPITLILMLSTPVSLLWRYSGTLFISSILLMFSMPDTTFMKSMAASILMLLLDFFIMVGLGLLFG